MTVQLATVREARHEIRRHQRRAYSGPGFGPRSFECVGLGLGVGMQFSYSVGAAGPLDLKSLFPGAYQVVQTDKGLTYGGTTLATGTTPPVGTLAGTITGAGVPIWFKCTTGGAIGSGAVFSAYADGAGTTPFMTGIAPSAGTPVALTGVGAGLTHAWAAGTAATDNVWKATCSALADQSGNGYHFTQAAPGRQPIISIGLNGKVSLLFDGVDDVFTSTCSLPAPGTTPLYGLAVYRVPVWGANHQLLTSTAGGGPGIYMPPTASPAMQPYCGAFTGPATATLPINTWGVVEVYMSNSSADSIRAGTGSDVTGVGTSGNAASGSTQIAENGTGLEFLGLVWSPTQPSLSVRNANRTLLGSSLGYGASLAV
jgi:hypothetical protein